jgi:acyl-CoA thioesterase-1
MGRFSFDVSTPVRCANRVAARRAAWLLLPILAWLLAGCSGMGSDVPSAAGRAAPTPTEPSLAAPLPGSYAALGASETYGVGASPHTRGYAYLIARALHPTQFVDEGIPGTTLSAAYQTELTNALAIRPSLVTVFFGYNDLAAGVARNAFLSDLRDLAVTLRRARSRVVIIGLPDLSLLPSVSRRFAAPVVHARIASWNAGMARVARETSAVYLDLNAFSARLAAHPEYISSDGLHPSNAGHTALAGLVVTLIRKDSLWKRQ